MKGVVQIKGIGRDAKALGVDPNRLGKALRNRNKAGKDEDLAARYWTMRNSPDYMPYLKPGETPGLVNRLDALLKMTPRGQCLDCGQIARVCGVSRQTIWAIERRALRKLRVALGEGWKP